MIDGRPFGSFRLGEMPEPVATYSAMGFAWAAFNQGTELFEG
jgi:hypothetical protein